MFNWFKKVDKELSQEEAKPQINFEIWGFGNKHEHLKEELKKALEDSGFPSTYSGGGVFNFLKEAGREYGRWDFKRYTFISSAYEANKAFVSDTEIKETEWVKSPTIKLCHSLINEHESWDWEYGISEDGHKRYWYYKDYGRVLIGNNTTCNSFNSAEAMLIEYFQNKWLTKQTENTKIAERNHLESLFGETA